MLVDEAQLKAKMKKILDYILSTFFVLYFGLILLIFHLLQIFALKLFGKKSHQRVVNTLNFFICYGWLITGSSVKLHQKESIPEGRSVIFVANHQSMFDIPGIIWFFRKHTPLFVAKKELAKGIPSISYNLRKGGAALIDRKDGRQAMAEIGRLGAYIAENNFSAAIFPEGTRSRTGQLKDFSLGGVSILLKKCPEALVVPIAIKNTAKFNPKGLYPLTSFTNMSWTSLKPIEPAGKSVEEIMQITRFQIATELGQ